MRRLVPLLLSAALLAPACTGSGGHASPSPHPSGSPAPALNAASAALLPNEAQTLPDVEPATFHQLLGQLKGTPVLVNIWASWCGPCTQEAPVLQRASETYGTRVQFVGIDILDDRASARSFMADFAWRYPSLFDVNGAVRDELGLVGQPVTLVFDASGKESWRWSGPVEAAKLDSELRKVL